MAQSPELAGGAGFTFEGAVAAYYLVSLLAEGHAPGIENRVVTRVAVQQRDMGSPLDDIIVDFAGVDGAPARLSLQCKRKLVISASASNTDFSEVVRDAWSTLCDPSFRIDGDRVGAAVGEVAMGTARALRNLCEAARVSSSADFAARLRVRGNANAAMRGIYADITQLLGRLTNGAAGASDVQRLLAHFVLVEFDFLHTGAVDPPQAIDRLSHCLAEPDRAKAALLWSHLQTLARSGAGIAAAFERPQLVLQLSSLATLGAASSLAKDVEILRALAQSYADRIPDDVGGVHLPRPALDLALSGKLETARLIQVRGLAGCGKSVLLKSRVLESAAQGATLFLKADQLEGRSWRAFATQNGLSAAPLRALLVEIGATGTPILFIDAIDRVEIEQQPILTELLRLVAQDPLLTHWRVVVTARDTGIELLRTWIGDVLDALGVATVAVDTLDDAEAEILAGELPQLRPLLFGAQAVRDIVRRPFFAKVLTQGYAAIGNGFEPKTEVDLADHWWTRGGYDASGRNAIVRQRAIVELAQLRASQPVGLLGMRALSASTVEELDGLVLDGILQWTKTGHLIRFAHDIFFEWGFYHRLEDEGDGWIEAIRRIGEPPAVARAVELLAQARFAEGEDWRKALPTIAASNMRAQWLRAWLLGPIGSSIFAQQRNRYWCAVLEDDFRLLKKALVWFQAEKTIPNPNILAAPSIDPEQRQRIADMLGWPSDFSAWMRFIGFLIAATKVAMPARLYPDLLAVFEVWQRTVGDTPNPTSQAILERCANWLEAIDARTESPRRWRTEEPTASEPTDELEERADPPHDAGDLWKEVAELDEFRGSLVDLILRSAKSYPAYARAYLERMLGDQERLDRDIARIFNGAPALAAVYPALLARATFQHLRDKLPEEEIAEDEARNRAASEARSAALAKPEAERTRADQAAIQGLFFTLGSNAVGTMDWLTLSLERDIENFSPISPLREPFPSLFAHAPDEALGLIKAMCAHAMEAWRQLHRLDDRREGTPLPVRIAFPWGEQDFWGGPREYLWHRGLLAPNALGCAFLALEDWVYAELERRVEPDALIRRIVEGNNCVAILGVAVTIALERDLESETSLALVTSQHLQLADQNRLLQEHASGFGARIEYGREVDRPHGIAVAKVHARAVRKRTLAGLVTRMLFSGGRLVEPMKARFETFPDDLPFTYAEQRNNPETVAAFKAEAEKLRDLADPNHYRVYRTEIHGEVVVVHEAPSERTPEAEARRQVARDSLAEQAMWGAASQAFEAGDPGDPDMMARRILLARSLDTPDLFIGSPQDMGTDLRRGAVAAMAAASLRFRDGRDEETLNWARDLLERVVSAQRRSGHVSSATVIPWHEAGFAARGIAADIRAGTSNPRAHASLLCLAGHPLETVSALAVREALGLWDVDSRLGWAALHLGFKLCRYPRRGWADVNLAEEEAERHADALAHAQAVHAATDWPILPEPPPAWVELTEAEARAKRYRYDQREAYDAIDPMRIWAPSEEYWYGKGASALLDLVPVGKVLSSPARDAFLDSIAGLLDWTIARNAPPWKKPGRRSGTDSDLFEWTHSLGSCLGKIWVNLRLADEQARLLDPVLAQEGDACWSLLAPLADAFVCGGVYDSPALHPDATELLLACADRLLASRQLDRGGWRSGELSGFDQPKLARTLMFVSIDHAGGAARFVNGDWGEIDAILPIVERLVGGAGWAPSIMASFLKLCERARDAYPADRFADQLLAVLGPGDDAPPGWSGTFLSARIAGVIQHLSTRESPMSLELAQTLLRLLDRLVDMGDRRSAALQLSEAFREVRIDPGAAG